MRTYFYAHSIGWMRDKFFSDSDKKCAKCRSDIIESGLGYDYVLDHIVPIALGGEEFNSDNFQILCNSCNKIKTKEDMKKIYEFKKCKGIAKLDSLLGQQCCYCLELLMCDHGAEGVFLYLFDVGVEVSCGDVEHVGSYGIA